MTTYAYGTSPVAAMFQGFIDATPELVTRVANNCVGERTGVGVIVLTLNTPSVDDANYLAVVRQYSTLAVALTPLVVNIEYGTPGPNQIQFTFGSPTELGVNSLFNIVVYQCTDSTQPPETPGNP